MRFKLLALFVVVAAVTCACDKTPPPLALAAAGDAAVKTNLQIFQVRGVVRELEADGKTVNMWHEEIPNYMSAMIMPLEVKNTNELRGLKAGASVSFRMLVTEDDGWIDQIKVLDTPLTNAPPLSPPALPPNMRIVRDVAPLNVGDAVPEYHFTNQLAKAISLSQLRGQALAITFIFTRCPFPTFCPLMENNFRAVQDKLLQTSNAPTNWHLLTVSFDPEYDTPERLANWSQAQRARPEHWSHVTGELIDVTAIAEQFGLQFWKDPGSAANIISHNLRTAVIDSRGRVQKIFTGNEWKPEEVVAELIKAAKVKD